MTVELNQVVLRRLIKLYLALLGVGVVIGGAATFVWREFDEDFTSLVAQHFGESGEPEMIIAVGLFLICVIAHLTATFRILRLRPWARTLSWASLLPLTVMGLLPQFRVMWIDMFSDWIGFGASAVFGMILLLAYSRDHGAIWFTAEIMKENA